MCASSRQTILTGGNWTGFRLEFIIIKRFKQSKMLLMSSPTIPVERTKNKTPKKRKEKNVISCEKIITQVEMHDLKWITNLTPEID